MRERTLLFIFFGFVIFLILIDRFFYIEFCSEYCRANGNLDFCNVEKIISEEKEKCELKMHKIQKRLEKIEKRKRIKSEFNLKLNSIQSKDLKEWFLDYKKILDEYSDYTYLKMPKTVYEEYSLEHLHVFQKLIAAETTGGDFESKCNVASVVWNRLLSNDYPDDIISVIYQKDGSVQFSPTYDGRIDMVEVTADDILAVEYTYIFGSTAYDCIAFDNVRGNSWNKNRLEKVFTDNIGHSFYR